MRTTIDTVNIQCLRPYSTYIFDDAYNFLLILYTYKVQLAKNAPSFFRVSQETCTHKTPKNHRQS